ncbi:D(1)-like dopamine receptor [Trichoplax sp. H2]|nr:D(1)-like dopamine receptor [Trichoplax sp. H2]|eukprot:RDD46771.1 D(1)-like dopamine receptor [Trichoplax sp. H2]
MSSAALITLGSMSLVTNSFLLSFIWSKSGLRSLSTAILQSMLINGILWSIYVIVRFTGQFSSYSIYLCILLPRLGQGMFVNLNLHACFIMLERYVSVAFPFRYERLITKTTITIIITTVWTLSSIIPITAVVTLSENSNSINNCSLKYVNSFVVVDTNIHICLLVVACFLLVILFLMYSRVICLVRTQEIRLVKSYTLEDTAPNDTRSVRVRRERKAVIQAIVVFTFYFTLLMPFLLSSTLAFYNLTSTARLQAASTTRYLAFSYPAIQPFIYAYYTANIRKALISTIFKRKTEFNQINTMRSPNISTH